MYICPENETSMWSTGMCGVLDMAIADEGVVDLVFALQVSNVCSNG